MRKGLRNSELLQGENPERSAGQGDSALPRRVGHRRCPSQVEPQAHNLLWKMLWNLCVLEDESSSSSGPAGPFSALWPAIREMLRVPVPPVPSPSL